MIFGNTHTVLDFGTSKVSTLISSNNKGEIEHLGLGVCEYAGFRNGQWVAPEYLTETIRLSLLSAQEKCNKKVKMVDVIIPGEWCLTCFTKVTYPTQNVNGRISEHDIEGLIQQGADLINWPENYVVLHAEPVVYLLDGINKKQAPVGSFAREITAYVSYTAVDEIFILDISDILDKRGIGVGSVIPSTKAYAEYISNNSIKNTNIIIDTGYFSTDIIICEHNHVIMHHNIAIGGYHITSDLMLYLNLDSNRHVAELVKRNCSVGMDSLGLNKIVLDDNGNKIDFSVEEAQDIIEKRLYEIMYNMIEDAKRIGIEVNNRSGIYVTGGGLSRISGAREICTKMIEQNISILSPNKPVQANVQYMSLCAGMEYILKNNRKRLTFANILNGKSR